ncbi:hypothetical protein F4804DRAFT_296416 [Jackrogersella minutella]|nr:hypothetical protein F4804DRAFT_296416 [Jackrogersella minutella]
MFLFLYIWMYYVVGASVPGCLDLHHHDSLREEADLPISRISTREAVAFRIHAIVAIERYQHFFILLILVRWRRWMSCTSICRLTWLK